MLNIRAAAFDRDSLVRVVAIGAAHFTFRHRVVMRQLELRAHFQVTLETGFGVFARINNMWIAGSVASAARFHVQAARSMAIFAAQVNGLLHGGNAALRLTAFSAALVRVYDFLLFPLQPRVRGCSEVAHDLMMARVACLGANELRAGNTGRGENGSI